MNKIFLVLLLGTGLSFSAFGVPKPAPKFKTLGKTSRHAGANGTATHTYTEGTPPSNEYLEKLVVVPTSRPRPIGLKMLPDSAPPLKRSMHHLLRSGYRHNPSFQYNVQLTADSAASCGGTLVSEKNGYCAAATASHCLMEALKNDAHVRFNDEVNAYEGRVEMTTAHWGTVWALAFVNKVYAEEGLQDIGMLVWKCDGTKGALRVRPTRRPVKWRQWIYYGKIRSGRGNDMGFHKGFSSPEPGVAKVNGVDVGKTDIDVRQEGPRVEFGDSGTGAFRYNDETKQWEWVGALATTTEKGPATFSSNESLTFVHRLLQALEMEEG